MSSPEIMDYPKGVPSLVDLCIATLADNVDDPSIGDLDRLQPLDLFIRVYARYATS
jgi:hypothetical protein